jgi:thiol-disulfide isomerase/thioredoxin
LHLTNEGFVPGQIQASADPKILRWHSPLFAQSLEFPLDAVRAVRYAVPNGQPKPGGQYCFELVGDDVLYGDLLALSAEELEVDAARIGRVHLKRASVGRFYPCQGRNLVYQGPDGLAGWKAQQWRDEGGELVTEQPGASLVGNLGLPAKAVIEFELSWKRKPDFVFALGVNDLPATLKHAFRIEVWDNDLVVVGESAQDADVVPLEELTEGEGHLRLQVYLDQEQGRLLLFSRSGKPLATLDIRAKKQPVCPSVRLTNRKGDLRLAYLRITRWNDTQTRQEWKDQPRVQRTDGSVVYGRLAAYDPTAKQFTVRDKTDTVVKQDALADVYLSPPGRVPAASNQALRVVYRDGTRLSGQVMRIEPTHLSLSCPGVKESLRLPLAEVRSLVVLGRADRPEPTPVQGRPGRLEMEDMRLPGRLVAGCEQPGKASCLVWHPDLAQNASPLLPGPSGRIVYREPPPPPPPVVSQNERMGMVGRAVVIGGRVRRAAPAPSPPPVRTDGPRCLHLRSGDTIPCEAARIDDKGVTFKSPLSDTTFVPHEKIKSVELIPTREPRLGKTRRERLLTLPRLQKTSPPTHLICSTNGDFLRGRVLAMDDKRLQVEVRLEVREIPRERVTQIIWLHSDELAGQNASPTRSGASLATRVQTLRVPDNRLTFVADKLEHDVLSGTSDILGACKARLADVDQLLFGAKIDESAATLASHRWKLHPATEPKVAQNGSAGEPASGIGSPLVGQPAFPFQLDLLDGKSFQLADHKGRVVVLDFWATWCGPCMQSMPQVDGVVREFAGQQVELLAVNLEEQPEQIKSILERHKLNPAVALDRDGAVAARYGVTAIPQTVVIDQGGKVARLFVGGGPNTAAALRKALQELTSGNPAPPSVQRP